jgi:serine/threonine protein kinase
MPSRFPFASQATDDALQEVGDELPPKRPRHSSLLRNIGGFWRRNHEQRYPEPSPLPGTELELPCDEFPKTRRSSLPENSPIPKAIPSLPRPQTFRRQESERRENLLEVPPSPPSRRTLSLDRRRGYSLSGCRRTLSPKPITVSSGSALNVTSADHQTNHISGDTSSTLSNVSKSSKQAPDLQPLQIPTSENFGLQDANEEDEGIDDASLQAEYERRWILNLSMHFRDKSNREKFFVTFAETPTKWRRLTISLDYRDAPEGSVEADLHSLHYQRDKSFRIYEAIRESLAEIQYYPTVTNLKLETSPEDGQLHVHVREDANEIIQFPSVDLFSHVQAPKYRESEVEFEQHLSGFVYKVYVGGRILIKKEIPGPDTIDEFLYEVNALDALSESKRVVNLEGLVTDESGLVVKGLLISWASQGALVDILFEMKPTMELPWYRREKWARQIVEGLSDIHEAGFVQGDFTLSNIVIDEDDNAMIIDINRRGCPVGWEPPELSRLIDSGQRISMCIGVKTDIFQLGMVLWGLGDVNDEPERVERPLPRLLDVPPYYPAIVDVCLKERPQERQAAAKLLRYFPMNAGRTPSLSARSVDFADELRLSDNSVSTHRSDKEYIDPDMAVTLEDVSARSRRRSIRSVSPFTSEQVTYFDPRDPDSDPASTSYRFESSGSWVVGRRGRSPVSSRRRRSSPFARTASSSPATSLSRSPPSRSRPRCMSENSENGGALDIGQDWPPVEDPRAAEAVEVKAGSSEATLKEQPEAHEQGGSQSELLHADSGFDEHMVEEINVDLSHSHNEVCTVDIVLPPPDEFYLEPPLISSAEGIGPPQAQQEDARTPTISNDARVKTDQPIDIPYISDTAPQLPTPADNIKQDDTPKPTPKFKDKDDSTPPADDTALEIPVANEDNHTQPRETPLPAH